MARQRKIKDPPAPRSPAPLEWARRFLPQYFSDEPAPFHAELFADLETGGKLIARVAPRGHAKSTCAALAFPLWCICEKRRRNIVIVTHETSLATQFVRDIRQEIETNEEIQAEYGDLSRGDDTACARPAARRRRKSPDSHVRENDGGARESERGVRRGAARGAGKPPKWSEAFFTTATGVTVQAKGTGASFRGVRVGPHRPDLIICDDIEKDEHVESPEGRRKLEQWLRRVVLPALAPEGRLLVLGSILHYDSLLANLRDRQRWPRWNYKVYRALEADTLPDGRHVLRSLWPARWPVEKLEEERDRVGTLAFEQEYMANPVDDSLRVFRPEWLQRCDEADLARREKELITLMAVDPATGASGGDFFAIWVGSIDRRDGRICTRVLRLERIGIVEQVRRILEAFERWKPLRVGIETTAYQVALKDVLEEQGRLRGLYLPVVALQTTVNKRARIEGSAPFYENGTFRLPATLDPDVESQFLHFPKGRHDDAPDVCAMGIELARSLRTTGRIEAFTGGDANPFARNGGW